MANEVVKPDFSYQWSSGGPIVAPSNVKIQTGWTAEVPPFQWENWSQNRQDNAILHLFQKGISEWDTLSNYYFTTSGVRSYVQGSDGQVYVAVADSLNQNPVTDATNTYWRLAFKDQSGSALYAPDTGTTNAYKATYTPVVTSVVDGMVLKFKALNANTGASTFTPNNGVITAAAIVGIDHAALPSGAIATNGDVWLQWNTSISGGSWVMIASSGGNSNAGRFIGVQRITTTGTYTPTPGTTSIVVELVGGGGAGGGCAITGAGQYTVGGGGGSGAYTKTRLTSGFSGQTVTIGLGGIGITTGTNPGSSTSFGALASAAGGVGGESQGPSNVVFTAKGGNGGVAAVSGNILNSSGTSGAIGVSGSSTTGSQGGPGAPGPFGGGGNGAVSGTGTGGAGSGPGAGGGGSGNNPSQATARPGGNGADGIAIIWEYK
jgi:hypothetical protein